MRPNQTKFRNQRLILTVLLAVAMLISCALPFLLSSLTGSKTAVKDSANSISANTAQAAHLADDTTVSTGLKKHVNIGYYLCGNGGSKTKLRDINNNLPEGTTGWDVINVSFLETKNKDGYTPLPTFDLHRAYGKILTLYDGQKPPPLDDPEQIARTEEFKSDIRYLQSIGKKVVLSCGGANGHVIIEKDERRDIFLNGLTDIIKEYGFDGFDIDFEGGSIRGMGAPLGHPEQNAQTRNVLYVVKKLKAEFGQDFIISAAPEQYYIYWLKLNNDGSGAFLSLLDAIREELTYVHVQIYNGNHGILAPGTMPERYRCAETNSLEGYIKTSRLLVDGFETRDYGYFKGLRQDQVAFGVPACTGAGGGNKDVSIYAEALDELIQEYPNFRGIMTWSTGWDEVVGKNRFRDEIGKVIAKHGKPYPNVKTPKITTQPIDYKIMPNESATLTVEAMERGASLSYQWYETTTKTNVGGTKINGATNAEFIAETQNVSERYYYCEITAFDKGAHVNKRAVNRTRSAHVIVYIPVSENPTWERSKNHYNGGDKVFWNGKDWTAKNWTNAEPGKNADWAEKIIPVPINAIEPEINKELGDKEVEIGGDTSLVVTAKSKSGTLTYQWYSTDSMTNLNGQLIDGATSASYSPRNNVTGTKYYFCVVTNTDNSSKITGDKTANVFSRIASVNVGGGDPIVLPNVGWRKDRIYQKGEILSGEGRYFKAERVTKGEKPGESDIWVEIDTPVADVDYAVGTKYRSMTIVAYNGKLYQATRFTTTVPGEKGWREIV